NWPGCEWRFSMPDAAHARLRGYMVGEKFLSITVVGPEDWVASQEAERVLDSFKLAPDVGKGNLGEKDWKEFVWKEGGCTAWIPGNPVARSELIPGTKLTRYIQEAAHFSRLFRISWSEVPGLAKFDDPTRDLLFAGVKHGFVTSQKAKVTEEKT